MDMLSQENFIIEKSQKNNILEKCYKNNITEKPHKTDILENYDKNNIIDYFELIELVEMKKQLKVMLEWFNNRAGEMEAAATKEGLYISDKLQGELKNKSFLVYSTVLDKLNNFCEAHKEYKRQDIYSQALLEFIEKYS